MKYLLPNYNELEYNKVPPGINKRKLTAYKIFLLVMFSLISYMQSFGQFNSLDTVSNSSNDSTEYFAGHYPDNESEYFNPFYYKINLEAGYSSKNNMKLPDYTNKNYFNISYSISYFMVPLEEMPSQVGLFNEIGLYNTSLYLNIGPEARIIYNFYLIPYFGIALVPFSKYQNEDIALVYYLGLSAGYNFKINQKIEYNIEVSSDFLKLKRNNDNIYIRTWFVFNLSDPL